MESLITSTANPVAKRVRQLRDRKHRRREGAFFVEGIKPVRAAVETGHEIELIIIAPELLDSADGQHVAEEQLALGTRVLRFGSELFRRLSSRDNPAGMAAIVRMRASSLRDLPVGAGSVFAGLYEVANPGNLGTVIRTAHAAGASGVILIGQAADPFDPLSVKASMGALFSVPVSHVSSPMELFTWAAENDVHIVTASGDAPEDYRSAHFPAPVMLLFGNEGSGLPDDIITRGDRSVRIPMAGTAESLNLAVAAGILLFHAAQEVGALRKSG